MPIVVNTQSLKLLVWYISFKRIPELLTLKLTSIFPVISVLERLQIDSLLLHLLCHFHSEHQGWVTTKKRISFPFKLNFHGLFTSETTLCILRSYFSAVASISKNHHTNSIFSNKQLSASQIYSLRVFFFTSWMAWHIPFDMQMVALNASLPPYAEDY